MVLLRLCSTSTLVCTVQLKGAPRSMFTELIELSGSVAGTGRGVAEFSQYQGRMKVYALVWSNLLVSVEARVWVVIHNV